MIKFDTHFWRHAHNTRFKKLLERVPTILEQADAATR